MGSPPATPPSDPEKKRLDRLALIVSLLALTLSGLSFLDAHKAAKRDDERARPQFLLLKPTVTLWPSTSPAGSVLIGLQNTGELEGWLTQVAVRPLPGEIVENGPDHNCYEDIVYTKAILSQVTKTDAVLSKRSMPFVAIFDFPKSCPFKQKSVALEIDITYKDSQRNSYTQNEYCDAVVGDSYSMR